MSRTVPIIKKYSMSFKMKVVSEIEKGKFSIDQAREIYDIGGSQTIQRWMSKLGKANLISKVVKIEMKDEKDKLTELKKEKQLLESALAQSQLKVFILESLVDIAKDKYGIDLKKTGDLESVTQKKKRKKEGLKPQ